MKKCHVALNENTRPKRRKPTFDLTLIASKQKTLIWLSVPWVVLGLAPVPTSLAGLEAIAFWIVHVACIVMCYQLAGLLHKNPTVWALLALVPFVNLFAIARLVRLAARQQKGLKS